jgi:SNF2-related domain/Helicase conserved C-terminal domain/LAGLIDADG-like domain
MSGVFGELDPSGEFIRLTFGTQDARELDRAAGILRSLTPAFNPAAEPGVMSVPVSWAAVTQLAHAFTGEPRWDGSEGLKWLPGPQLGSWLIAEIIRRSCEGDFTGQPPVRAPMKHQAAGAVAVGMNGRFLFADDMGPQPVDTPVMLTDGTWTELGKLQPGDRVYGQHGFAARVAEVKFFGRQPVYRVTFNDRTSTLATARHLWRVYTPNHRARPTTHLGEVGYVRSTQQLADAGLRGPRGNRKFFLPQQPVLAYGRDARWFELDPYSYGVLLGDGCLTGPSARLTCPDEDVLYRVQEAVLESTLTTSRQERYPDHCAGVSFHQNGRLSEILERLGARHLAGKKAVHASYLNGDVRVRRELLRGLLDTDGTVTGNGAAVEFSSASAHLASGVAFLARSLGAVVTESAPQPAHYVLNGERFPGQDKHRVLMRFPADGPNPFWCRRKATAWSDAAFRVQRKEPPRSFESIEPEGEAEVCCIRLEGEGHGHVYLTDRTLIPTHNTGKSQTYLMSLAELEARGRHPWPALFVCPAGVVDTVLEEIPKNYPDWKAVAYRGSSRAKYLRSDARILVMGYETLRNDTGDSKKPGPLDKLKAGTLVGDEIHAVCNFASLQSRKFRRLAVTVRNTVAGSGTPITQTAAGFWPLLNGMYPKEYPSRERFKGHYFVTRGKIAYGNGDADIAGLDPAREPEFRVAMQGVFRRVAKEDVLDLPPKTYITRYVEIPPAWRAAYDQMQEDMLAELPGQMTPLEAQVAIVKMMRLRQLACSACDVEVTRAVEQNPRSPKFGQEVEHTKVTLKEPSWKGTELVEILRELHEAEGEFDERGGQHGHVTGSRPAIAFAESSQLTRLCGLMAEKKGYAVGYIDGTVPPSERNEARLAFQANKLDLICVTTATGGAGLNLTAADTEIFLAPPWGFVPRTQAESRAHRLGQTKPVQVIDVVCKNSVEARVFKVLREKAGNLADLVMDRRIVESFLGGRGKSMM